MFYFLFIFGFICYEHTRGLTTPEVTPATTPINYGYDPVIGVLTPSRDIQDFVASVFGLGPRQGENYRAKKKTTPALISRADSGELLKPKNISNHAHIGYEQYWPGGEWVFRKAEIDRCNNSDTACSKVFGKYGKVCAGNHDLTAHTTFDSICDMYDANCRDGTYTAFTTSGNETVFWMPVGPNGYLDFKVATGKTVNKAGFILARTRSIHARPRWSFEYASHCQEWDRGGFYKSTFSCITVNEAEENSNHAWNMRHMLRYKDHPTLSGRTKYDLRDKKVREFRLQWNESTGEISCRFLINGKKPLVPSLWKNSFEDASMTFAAHYFGVWGGTPEVPTWWEITGYLLAYRGKCRADLPTLPTEPPIPLRQNIDIEQYNFAERMDEFGYNYSRLPKKENDHYVADEDLSDANLYG